MDFASFKSSPFPFLEAARREEERVVTCSSVLLDFFGMVTMVQDRNNQGKESRVSRRKANKKSARVTGSIRMESKSFGN